MKFSINSCTLFFLVTVIFFSPLAFAPWSAANPPRKTDENPRTCVGWLEYHGFILGTLVENRELSLGRDFTLDPDACKWAAIYAFAIGGAIALNSNLTPERFCLDLVGDNNAYPYMAIMDESRTCEDWISLYGYIKNYALPNVPYARSQNFVKNYAISFWADSYGSYLVRWKEQFALTPPEFCAQLGKTNSASARMSFMSRRITRLTCEAWIKLYEFTDNIRFNYDQAQRMQGQKTQSYINYWPKRYAKLLRRSNLNEMRRLNMTPGVYCNSKLDDVSTEFNFSYPNDELENLILGVDDV